MGTEATWQEPDKGQDYGVVFGVYKDQKQDADGNTYIAQAHLGFFAGLFAGVDIAIVEIKSHPEKGLQIEWPKGIQPFVEGEHREGLEIKILKAFVESYINQGGEGHECEGCGKCGLPDIDDEVPPDATYN